MHTLDKQGLGPGAGKCVSDSRGGGAARTTVAVQQVLSWVVLPWAVLTRVVPSWAGAPLDDAPQRVLTGVVLSWAGAYQGGAHLGLYLFFYSFSYLLIQKILLIFIPHYTQTRC